MNNNINLPTSGSLNWGAGLNSYLSNLSKRVSSLELKYNNDLETYVPLSLGYAGSGVVGECEASSSGNNITFKGDIYFSGPAPIYLTNINTVFDATQLTDNTPYYIYLRYDSTLSVPVAWETSHTFDINYLCILLGFYYKGQFIPYYFSSGKTLMQHNYELKNCWVDLDTTPTYLTINIGGTGLPTFTLGANGINWTGECFMYGGGFGVENQRIVDSVKESKMSLGSSPKSIVFLRDEQVNGKLTCGINSFVSKPSSGLYFRILIDAFSNIIVQQSLENYQFPNTTNNRYCEEVLWNAKFASLSEIWEAGCPVEVARFGYNAGAVSSYKYIQNSLNAGQQNFYFVKTMDKNVLSQQRHNIWLTQDSQIYTEKVSFRKNSSDIYGFQLNYTSNPASHITTTTSESINNYNPTWYEGESAATPALKSIELPNSSEITYSFEYEDPETHSVITIGPYNVQETVISGKTVNVGHPNFDVVIDGGSTGDLFYLEFRAYDNAAGEIISASNLNTVMTELWNFRPNFKMIFNNIPYPHQVLFDFSAAATTSSSVLWSNTKRSNISLIGTQTLTIGNSDTIQLKIDDRGFKFYGKDVTIQGGQDLILNGGSLRTLSDERYKENITINNSNYLDVVINTPIIKYNYINSSIQHVGIGAQTLEQNIKDTPHCFVDHYITPECADKRMIKETKLVYILWKALQEEVEERKKLEKYINSIKGE